LLDPGLPAAECLPNVLADGSLAAVALDLVPAGTAVGCVLSDGGVIDAPEYIQIQIGAAGYRRAAGALDAGPRDPIALARYAIVATGSADETLCGVPPDGGYAILTVFSSTDGGPLLPIAVGISGVVTVTAIADGGLAGAFVTELAAPQALTVDLEPISGAFDTTRCPGTAVESGGTCGAAQYGTACELASGETGTCAPEVVEDDVTGELLIQGVCTGAGDAGEGEACSPSSGGCGVGLVCEANCSEECYEVGVGVTDGGCPQICTKPVCAPECDPGTQSGCPAGAVCLTYTATVTSTGYCGPCLPEGYECNVNGDCCDGDCRVNPDSTGSSFCGGGQ
jgi:hypothetical protein